MVLHLQQVDQLGLATATLHHLVQVLLRLLDELVDGVLIGEDAVLLCVLEDSQVGLSGHQQPVVLDDVDEAEAQEVKRDVHEVRGAVGHQPNNIASCTHDLRVEISGDLFLNLTHTLRFFHV